MEKVCIIISGLAGVGKSTLAKKLAKRFGLKYICGGELLKEVAKELGYKVTEHWWESKEGFEFVKKRMENKALDKKLDEKLIEIASKGNCVITSWSLPWIYKGKAIKIWLHASLEERAKRIASRDNIAFEEALKIVEERDKENAKLFKAIYGYELGKDLSVFNLIVETENKTPEEVEREVVDFLKKRFNI